MDNKIKLSDEAIAEIARLLQIAILTGTDVTDELRLLELYVSDDTGELLPHPDHMARIESFIENALINKQ